MSIVEKSIVEKNCQERAKTRKLFNLKSNWACPHYMHLLLLLINLPKWQVYVLNGGSHNTLQNIFSFYHISRSPVLVCKDSPCLMSACVSTKYFPILCGCYTMLLRMLWYAVVLWCYASTKIKLSISWYILAY